MGDFELGVVLVLLGACLVALLLVLVARREAADVRRQANEEVASLREDLRAQSKELDRRSERMAHAERELAVERRELGVQSAALNVRAEELQAVERRLSDEAERYREEAIAELEAISGLSAKQASDDLVRRLTDDASHEAAARLRRIEFEAKREADAVGRRILVSAIQRLAVPTSAQSVVTILTLPTEDMKGRIIGKEGRNIRTFEALTGVNVIVDDTPGAVMLSCFDAERREIAEIALRTLMEDGRIHPQRIEAAFNEAKAGARDRALTAGYEAAEAAGVGALHPDLVKVLGALRLRTSYGQNVLQHLVECAQLAGFIAAELGADQQLARRGAFLHDIGKALTGSGAIQGTHARVGADLANRCGEDERVVNAIAAHHDEVPAETLEAVIVQVADAISAARPGARREDVDQFLERLDSLEHLIAGHQGVSSVVAMSSGREVRVVVQPEEVDDEALPTLAQTIASHIENELSYPGEIKVTVVRELRATATAG